MQEMLPFRNPFVWLWRFRHRKGYGIHSPFAFSLVTQVLYSPGHYYAYEWLDGLMSRWQRAFPSRRKACLRLLFRLANYWQPSYIEAPEGTLTELAYLHAGCGAAKLSTRQDDSFVLHGKNGTMFVVYDMQRHLTLWSKIVADPRVHVSFDLRDMGIAFDNPNLQRQHYIINW